MSPTRLQALRKVLSPLRTALRNLFLPYFRPAATALVPGMRRYLLLRPTVFELWFRGRALWYVLTRGWNAAHEETRTAGGTDQHLATVVDHNFGNRWLFSRRRTEKLMNILRCVGRVSSESRVLCIGPRNEAEILLLSLYGFELRNITGVDLLTYSPLIRRMDMHSLKLADDTFDIVYVLYTLSYAHDLKKACSEIVRVLKDGGIVAAGFQQTPRYSRLRAVGSELTAGLDDLFDHFRPYLGHIYWQEEDPVTGVDGDHLVTAIFSVKKSGADTMARQIR